MPLTVNLRHLEKKPLQIEGELSPEELDLQFVDELVRAPAPLKYSLEVQKIDRNVLVQGRLHTVLACECARCLKPFEFEIDIDHWVAHLPLEGEESAEVKNDLVDLTPHIREDILLGFPQHPLCETECAGLSRGAEQKPARQPDEGASPWSELDKLKF